VSTVDHGLSRAARGITVVAQQATSAAELASLAYLAVYACGFSGRGTLPQFKAMTDQAVSSLFLQELAAKVTDSFQVSLTVESMNSTYVFATYGGIRVRALRRSLSEGTPDIGSQVNTHISAILPGLSPGFLVRRGAARPLGVRLSRLYLNIGPRQAGWVLGDLARALDRADVRFDAKVLGHPRSYKRRDAAVLYFATEEAERIIQLVLQQLSRDSIRLRRGVPALCGTICDGLGFADEPDDIPGGLSFGQWVGTLLTASLPSSGSPADVRQNVERALREAGRDPSRPYLRA
jgi:hypothetical protein